MICFWRIFAADRRLPRSRVGERGTRHFAAQNLSERGCGQCPHFWLRTRSYIGRTGPDCLCFLEFPVFAGAGMRFESHLGHVFSLFRGLLASECAQIVHLWAPSGAFFIGGRCGGRLPPSIAGATGCCSLPVHGRSWLGRHDVGKIWCGFLYRIAACSPGSSLAAVGG